ncbi:cysteine desulfurase [Candidatus Babeliales bacterium]|nr:cysteine desulfurase [Candidatus Babeliales bacterium]
MAKNDINIAKLRDMFPIFQNKHNFIYLDSASTAQVPQSVIDATAEYYARYKANVGRGIYHAAEHATEQFEHARKQVATLINAHHESIVFTSGATESINIVAANFASFLQSGDEIVVSNIEHHSNFVPWQQLAIQKKLKLVIVPANSDGFVDADILQKHVTFKTKLISIVHTSNVTGASNDVAAFAKIAHAVGAKILVDASQSIVHQKIDATALQCDFLVFSGHKLFGPTGVGILYVAPSAQMMIQPLKFGGGMVFSVQETTTKMKQFPYCFDAGTPNIAGVIGLGAAVEFVQNNINFEQLAHHETGLVKKLYDALQIFDDVHVLSIAPDKQQHVCMLTFYSKKHHAHDIASFLDVHGIAVRAGHHCVQMFHENQGVNASVRVSFAVYNTSQEVDYLINAFRQFLQ